MSIQKRWLYIWYRPILVLDAWCFWKIFGDFDRKVSDYFSLKKLDPGYEVYLEQMEFIKIGDTLEKIYTAFELEDKSSILKLNKIKKSWR